MNYLRIALIIVFSTTCITNVLAQEVSISGEIRPRFEYRNGYKSLMPDSEEPIGFVNQRTRLNAFYGSKVFRSGLVLQNVRTWGDVAQLNYSDANGVAVHEAWGEILFSSAVALKAGRQEIIYDDHRIFGNVGWAQQARSHDAAILKYNPSENHLFHAGFAYNVMGEPLYKTDYSLSSYKSFQYVYYKGQFNKLSLAFLGLNNGMAYMENGPDTVQEVAYSQTIGAKVAYQSSDFNANAVYYFQGGQNKFNTELSAMYFSANVNYNFSRSVTVGLGTEFLSGTSSRQQQDTNGADHSFKPYYGTNHKFNGWMDYFYVGNYMYSNGLFDIYLPLTLKIKKFTFTLIPHNFMTAATISEVQTDGEWQDFSTQLGQEIDFTVQYIIRKDINISAGYSQMFATKSMQVLKGGNYKNSQNWAWLMITFKPTFYTSS